MMGQPSAEAKAALELVKVLQAELASTRRLALTALGVASAAIGALSVLGFVCTN